MRKHNNPWPKLFFDTLALGMSANTVIALRVAKLARGGAAANSESKRMVAEKVTAAAEAGLKAAGGMATGKPERAAGHAIAVYQKRVNANLRRLTKG